MAASAVATDVQQEKDLNPWRRFMQATLGRALYRRFTANQVTTLGFVLGLVAYAVFDLRYYLHIHALLEVALVIAVFGGMFDGADGAVARLREERLGLPKLKSGEFLDSSVDRFNDFAMPICLAVAMLARSNNFGILGCVAMAGGSQLPSYFRAKAEKLEVSYQIKNRIARLFFYVGERMGRLILTGLMVAISPLIGLQWVGWAVAAAALFTAIQRFAVIFAKA